jgi:hypothetical protein
VTPPIALPWLLRGGLEVATRALFDLGDQSCTISCGSLARPRLCHPFQLSWRVFKNLLLLFIGGVAAVIITCKPRR